MSRKVFIDNEDFSLKWEKIDGSLFVHVEIYEATVKVIKAIKEAWFKFQAQAYFEGYEYIFTYTQDPRIVNIVGGAEEVKDERLNDVPGWRMYKWELK